ncbi:MAG: hypothetical protein ACK4S0_00010 [Sediminibacterium sp.]
MLLVEATFEAVALVCFTTFSVEAPQAVAQQEAPAGQQPGGQHSPSALATFSTEAVLLAVAALLQQLVLHEDLADAALSSEVKAVIETTTNRAVIAAEISFFMMKMDVNGLIIS